MLLSYGHLSWISSYICFSNDVVSFKCFAKGPNHCQGNRLSWPRKLLWELIHNSLPIYMLLVLGSRILSSIKFINKPQKPAQGKKENHGAASISLYIIFLINRFLLRTKLKILSFDSFIGHSVQDSRMWRIFLSVITTLCSRSSAGKYIR